MDILSNGKYPANKSSNFATNGFEIDGMFHYPIAVWDRQHYGSIHLYGHVHANIGNYHPLHLKLKNAYNVGVDVCHFEPKTLAELMA